MNKEEIEQAREYLKQQEKQDAEETKEDLRTLYKILKDEHREGTLTIEKGLKYISKLELEVASYKMIHEHDLAMIEEATNGGTNVRTITYDKKDIENFLEGEKK